MVCTNDLKKNENISNYLKLGNKNNDEELRI